MNEIASALGAFETPSAEYTRSRSVNEPSLVALMWRTKYVPSGSISTTRAPSTWWAWPFALPKTMCC